MKCPLGRGWYNARIIPEQHPTLKQLVARYREDSELCEKIPEGTPERELLNKRLERHASDIVKYVTSDSFQTQLNNLNL